MSYLLCYIFENVVYSTHIFSQLTVFPVYVINYYITLSLEANMYLATFLNSPDISLSDKWDQIYHDLFLSFYNNLLMKFFWWITFIELKLIFTLCICMKCDLLIKIAS